MREAARALDDVSDHLGEVLRHADELLAEWSRFGAQVRAQVEREAAAVGGVVDEAVGRAASAGIDRAIADRLRTLTGEIERIEQRARAASRAVVEHREADRRVLWIVVAGVVLANALLVILLLRKPAVAPAPEPIRLEAPAVAPTEHAVAAGSGDAPAGSGSAAVGPSAGSAAPSAELAAGSAAGSAANAGTGNLAGSNAPGGSAASAKPAAPGGSAAGAKPAAPGGGKAAGEASGAGKPTVSPIVLPPKAGGARSHKKLP